MRVGSLSIALALSWLASSLAAFAVPIISIDLDPSLPGIQNNLSVMVGSSFEAAVVVTGDGASMFDTVGLDVLFDGAPPSILGLIGGPVAGDLAGTTPLAADAFFPIPGLQPGDSLLPPPIPPPIPGGFGGAGMTALGLPFPLLDAGDSVSILDLTFTALAPGVRDLSIASVDPAGDLLLLAGGSVPVNLETASVSVAQKSPVSEPTTLFLLGAGFAGFLVRRRS